MKTALKSPCYLVRNPYSYCFRMIVPKDLRKFVGKTELRYTLRTGYLGVAKNKAKYLAGQVQLIFSYLRKEYNNLSQLLDDQIQKLVHQFINTSIKDWDKRLYEDFDDEVNPPPFDDARTLKSYIDSLDDIRQDLVDNLNLGNFWMLEESTDELLEKNGINHTSKSSIEYRKLCVEIHKAEIKLLPLEKRHMQGDFSYKQQLPAIFPEVFEKPPEQINHTIQSGAHNVVEEDVSLLSTVIQNYVAENEKANWTEKSKQENEASLNLFMEVMGNVPIKVSQELRSGMAVASLTL